LLLPHFTMTLGEVDFCFHLAKVVRLGEMKET